MSGPKRNLAERFWLRVEKRGADECWLFTGKLTAGGYGKIGDGSCRHITAHRASYQVNVGPIPEGMFVLHRCDVRRCVNPAHLYLGTHADNMRDMTERGRKYITHGERSSSAKLNEEQVKAMRARCAAGEEQKALASEYGVSRALVCLIVNRKVWVRA
jgi:hypothetical protein